MPPHNEFQEERPLVLSSNGGVNESNNGDVTAALTARGAFESSNAVASRQYHDSRISSNHNGSSQETWHQSEGGLLKVSFRETHTAPGFEPTVAFREISLSQTFSLF
jgi:hypothetical protein